LPAGTYLFKVRGGNENAFGDFSPASTSVVWAPVQVTDQVTEDTTIGGSMADLIGPLAMGAVAYFAYQALYPEIMKALGDSELGSIFGIPTSAVQEMKNAAGNFKLVQVGDVIQTPYNNDTITFVAGDGIEITAVADDGIITISATGGGTGAVTKIVAGTGVTVTPTEGVGVVTISLNDGTSGPVEEGALSGGNTALTGSVFPTTYTNNNTTHPAIFTHNRLAFASSSYDGVIKNVVTLDAVIVPQNNGNSRYYTYCDYDSTKTLCEQNWQNWQLWKEPTTTTIQVLLPNTSNPPTPTYTVDGEYDCGGSTPLTVVPAAVCA
jgi:hypothetical protein